MAKYVRCIDDSGIPFTEGKCYNVENSDVVCHLITDDTGVLGWWNKGMFEEPYDVQEPIVFLTQQDFEDAVIKAVMQRLSVFEWREGWKTHFGMEDSGETN